MTYHIQVPCLSLTGVTSFNVNNPKLGKEVFCQHSSHQGSMGISSTGFDCLKLDIFLHANLNCLQRELPDSRSESLDHSQERKWVQPAKKSNFTHLILLWCNLRCDT